MQLWKPCREIFVWRLEILYLIVLNSQYKFKNEKNFRKVLLSKRKKQFLSPNGKI